MAWNQRDEDKKPDEKKPAYPDFNKTLTEAKNRLSTWLGGQKPSGNKPPGGSGWTLPRLLGVLCIGVIAVLVFSGFYDIKPSQRGVVLHYNQSPEVTGPGLHWYNPLLGKLKRIEVGKAHSYQIKRQWLTADARLVDVAASLRYRVSKAGAFASAAAGPITLLQRKAQTILRQEVGARDLADLLKPNTQSLADALTQQLGVYLAAHKLGLTLDKVSVSAVSLPNEVATAAPTTVSGDGKAAVKQAREYREGVLSKTRAKADGMLADAKAYRSQVVGQAKGKTARFTSLLAAYQQAPQVTRDRLYFDTMEKVLSQSRHLLVTDSPTGKLVLPPTLWQPTNSEKSAASSTSIHSEPPESVPSIDTAQHTAAGGA